MTFKVIVGSSGSVAALKLPEICEKLIGAGCEVKVIVTEHAMHFYNPATIPSQVAIHTDQDEWTLWSKRGDPVLHIELAKWADVFLIAPLDANTLAKVATGLCDNLLTCCVRAWDQKKPLLFCPAMNTQMYLHTITEQQLKTLVSWGYTEIPVVSKTLICGDTGLGAMAEVDDIVRSVVQLMPKKDNTVS